MTRFVVQQLAFSRYTVMWLTISGYPNFSEAMVGAVGVEFGRVQMRYMEYGRWRSRTVWMKGDKHKRRFT